MINNKPHPKRKQLIFWLIKALIVICVFVGFSAQAILNIEDYHVEYEIAGAGNITLESGYRLPVPTIKQDGEVLELTKTSSTGIEIYLPAVPWILGGILAVELLFRMLQIGSSPVPPPFWGEVFFGHKHGTEPVVSLPQAPGGLIAVRAWRWDGREKKLKSTAFSTKWETRVMQADEKPKVGEYHGVYAYRLGAVEGLGNPVIGIVSLSGSMIIHADNLVRACRCEILVLVTKKKKAVEALKERYQCPVLLARHPANVIQKWLISPEGIFWLRHNNSLVQKSLDVKIKHDIDEIMKNSFGGDR